MTKALLICASTFAACAAMGTATPGCYLSDCCPETPARPQTEEGLTITRVVSHDDLGNEAPLAIEPEGGTLDITGDTVVIRYEQLGVQHEIVYSVTEKL